jgi:hypothetical protein
MPIDTRRPISRMDFDTEDRLLPANHYRYGKNGRSGTSDKDGEGAVEGIRGNVLRNPSYSDKGITIVSCADVRNNAVISFVYQPGNKAITYTSAVVTNVSPPLIAIGSPSETIFVGTILRVTQGANVFVGKVSAIVLGTYSLTTISGVLTTDPITSIVRVNSLNRIERYFESSQTFENLTNPTLMGDVLAFTASTEINNPRVIESTFGQLLTWVSNPNGIICLMNIDRMKQGGEYYLTAEDSQYIVLAKQPWYKQPELTYYYDVTAINYLSADSYQFRSRYVFDDNQSSIYSPISKLSVSPEPFNSIGVTVNSGHATVRFVDLLVRNGNGGSGTENNEWYVFKTINKSEESWSNETDYEVRFFGNELLIAAARINTDKISESIPIYADSIEVTDNNQIIAGGITEGYGNVDMNVTFEVAYRDTGIYDYQVSTNTTVNNYSSETIVAGDTLYIRITTGVGVFEETFYKITADDLLSYPDNLGNRIVSILADMGANYTYNGTSKTITRSSGHTLAQLTVFNARPKVIFDRTGGATGGSSIGLGTGIMNDYFAYYVEATFTASLRYQTTGGNMTINYIVNGITVDTKTIVLTTSYQSFTVNNTIKLDTGDTLQITFTGGSLLNQIQMQSGWQWFTYGKFQYLKQGFKFDSSVYGAVVYYDQYLRPTFAQELGEVKIPDITNLDIEQYSRSTPLRNYIPYLSWQIKNLPPEQAFYYQFLLKDSTVSEFTYFTVTAATVVDTNVEITYLDMDKYIPEVGDLIRVVGTTTSGNSQKYLFEKQSAQPWYEVLSIDISTKKITVSKAIGSFNYESTLIEIRRKQPVNSRFFFECSNFYEIGNPTLANRYHKGETQDQDPNNPITVPAEGSIKNGQVWYRFHHDEQLTWTFDQERIYFVESFYPNDESLNMAWDKGRAFVSSQYAKQVYLPTGMRWSLELINQSLINGLATWDEGNYNNTINTKFGAITGMRQIGYTLKIIQWSNTNTAFIKRREVQNADGSTQLVVTDNLIGTINPSEMEFGTKYPGTILNTGTRLYFFDSLKSKYIVDDGNGPNEIGMYTSDLGTGSTTMTKYFRQVADMINSDSNYTVRTGFDYLFRDMYVSFINRVENTQETLYYNESQNAWKYFIDMEHVNAEGDVKYIIDCYGSVGQSFFAFLQANTFQFNKAVESGVPVYCDLFKINETDPTKPLVVETIGMIEADKVKVFQTHALHSNLQPELVELFIPATQMYPNGMYSVLKPANYKYREGVFYADIKRDAYTKGFTTNEAQLRAQIAGGRPMRGHVCLVRITYRTNKYIKLFTTSLGMTASELS